MRTSKLFILAIIASFNLNSSAQPDTRLTSWFTTFSGKYARIYTNDASKGAGNAVATWSNGTQTQSLPAYAGVQEVYSSSNWVYLRTSGMGFHTMGPWYLNAAHTTIFPNWPVNTKTLYRIPRNPSVPTSKTVNGGGPIGYFVDGVTMFNSWDAYYWNGTTDTSGGGTGYWNRDAYVNEGVSFDPAYAHQPQSGQYHYHADPIALRYLLGDHVDYNGETHSYSESLDTPTNHSPILGWVSDGFPVYGPYGYSDPTNAASGVRRMVSGYVLRNGQNGTQNLSLVGRTNIPAWAVRAYAVSATQSGPNVSSSYPLGRYMEDNDYLGDLGKIQGVDFDLDEHNGRFCVTPEFPNGTYAYFVAVDSTGKPVFPYNIGRTFYGSAAGGIVSSISESVTTNFIGGANLLLTLSPPSVSGSTVTLTWSAVEGGTYQVRSSTDLASWQTNFSGLLAQSNSVQTNLVDVSGLGFFRAVRTGLASYDPVSSAGGSGTGILSVSPSLGSRGTTVTITINLDPNAAPPPPPQSAPIMSVTVGSLTGSNDVHVSQTQVSSQITIPSNSSTGPQSVWVVFPGPPSNPSQTVTYTLTNAFTIN